MPNWYTYFDTRFDLVQGTQGWWRFMDPLDQKAYVKQDRTLAVHFGGNRVRSFRRNYSVSIVQFLHDLDGISLSQAAAMFREQPDDGPPVMMTRSRMPVLELPPGFVSLTSTDTDLGYRAREYVRSRGLDPFFLSSRGVGFCDDGPRMGYLCFPCYEHGTLVYYVMRDFLGIRTKKHLNLKDGEAPKTAGEVLFNSDALDTLDQVYLTEAAIDALTVGPAGVATLGKEVTAVQFSRLLRARCKRYIVLGDPGAYQDNLRIYSRLLPEKQVKVVDLTLLGGDVNKVGLRATLDLVERTDWLTPLTILGC